MVSGGGKKRKNGDSKAARGRLHTLDVRIARGPMTRKFVKKNKVVSRRIQIRGDQTLADLHDAIFDAFDRYDEHMYEFQFGGKRPMDPDAKRYGPSPEGEDPFDDEMLGGDSARTTIASQGLEVGVSFGYWFDFGDDWWHQIDVVAIEDAGPGRHYPRLIERIGESPPQYADL